MVNKKEVNALNFVIHNRFIEDLKGLPPKGHHHALRGYENNKQIITTTTKRVIVNEPGMDKVTKNTRKAV